MKINVRQYLDFIGVDYKSHGKNVGPNDINIDCPWCGADKHLGIHKNRGSLNCWVCNLHEARSQLGRYPTFLDLICELEGIDRRVAFGRLNDYSDKYAPEPEEETWVRPEKTDLPPFTTSFDAPSNPFNSHLRHLIQYRDWAYGYLKSRGFGVKTIQKYGLLFTPPGSQHPSDGRIIIPVYFKGKLVSWLGRDYTDSQQRYYNNPAPLSVERMRDIFYGWDYFMESGAKKVQMVEGAFDVWRLGDAALGLLRSRLSRQQLKLLLSANVESIAIILDRDAFGKAVNIAADASAFFNRLKVVDLPDDRDVADRDAAEIFGLIRETPQWVS